MQASILASLLLKQLGARRVVARAHDAKHAQVLERLGVEEVVLPSREIARRLAERVPEGGNADRHSLTGEYVLADIRLGSVLDGKTVAEVKLSNWVGRGSAQAIRARTVDLQPIAPGLRLGAGDQLWVVGERKSREV